MEKMESEEKNASECEYESSQTIDSTRNLAKIGIFLSTNSKILTVHVGETWILERIDFKQRH